MKDGYILKSLTNQSVEKSDLELINRYTLKKLSLDDVMIFRVVLCDNEIDRDFEAFDKDTLTELAKMFVGKSGITDHSMKSSDQTARIFKAEVETLNDKQNTVGEIYSRIVAKAYIIKTDKTADIIAEIESGIKKEVSVNCAVKKRVCSICGKDYEKCPHTVGKYYNDQLCFKKLQNAKDAYEWSFVAVPAQVNAGVIKSFSQSNSPKTCRTTDELFEKMEKGFFVNLSKDEALNISKKIQELEYLSKKGKAYQESLQKSFMQTAFSALPNVDDKILLSVSQKLNIDELCELTKALKICRENKKTLVPKTLAKIDKEKSNNTQFRI